MTVETEAKSRILKAVHQTARDLQVAGLIDERADGEHNALCLAPLPDYSREQ
ncbi:MAG: hypothetical protein HYY78_01950 [Betaproteobacteria bacterium]|nr:hypothetical protein [Betaproteobacteria bacterium]